MSDIINILAKLIGFDTTSRNSNRALIDFVRSYLDGFGVQSVEILDPTNKKACVFATIGATTVPGIVLAGHSDTVPVDGQNWTSDPFTLTERDGKLYGRGSCDMKGFIACCLSMVPELVAAAKAGTLKQPVHLAFTYDEETDMSGAANITDYMRGQGVQPEWVWIGEPTEHHIVDAHKGVAVFETTITGVPGHSSRPDLGLSAIELGHSFTGVLLDMKKRKSSQPFKPSRFDPPHTTISLGGVEGGAAHNIIADQWKEIWETRLHPGDDHDAMLADIESRAQELLRPSFAPFINQNPEVGCKTCTMFNIPPLRPTPDNVGQKRLGAVTGQKDTDAVSFATEAGFFQKLGTHVVVCGPGSIKIAHKADEYLERSQLTYCVDLMRSVLLPSLRL